MHRDGGTDAKREKKAYPYTHASTLPFVFHAYNQLLGALEMQIVSEQPLLPLKRADHPTSVSGSPGD